LLGLALVDAGVLALVALPVVAGLFLWDSVGAFSWAVIGVWAALALIAGLGLVWRERRARGDLAARDAALAAARLTGHDWVWECDESLVVTDSGHAVAQLLGLTAEQCVGRPLDELLYDDTNRTHARTQLEAGASSSRGGTPTAGRSGCAGRRRRSTTAGAGSSVTAVPAGARRSRPRPPW
jgi:PAS domain-containing protein